MLPPCTQAVCLLWCLTDKECIISRRDQEFKFEIHHRMERTFYGFLVCVDR